MGIGAADPDLVPGGAADPDLVGGVADRDFADTTTTPPSTISVDEDGVFGVLQAQQAQIAYARPFVDQDEVTSSTPLASSPDEDYWTSGTVPAVPTLRLYTQADVEETPAGSLFGQPDEDFWVSGVAPVLASLRPYWPTDLEEIPAGALHGQPDEDFWTNCAPFVPVGSNVQPIISDDVVTTQVASSTIADEDYWVSSATSSSQPVTSYVFVQNDDLPTVVVVDEDYWCGGVAPVTASHRVICPNDVEEIPSLFGPEEDLWSNPVAPATAVHRPFSPGDVEEVPRFFSPDEDYWYTRAAAEVTPTLPYPPHRIVDDAVVQTATSFVSDEDATVVTLSFIAKHVWASCTIGGEQEAMFVQSIGIVQPIGIASIGSGAASVGASSNQSSAPIATSASITSGAGGANVPPNTSGASSKA